MWNTLNMQKRKFDIYMFDRGSFLNCMVRENNNGLIQEEKDQLFQLMRTHKQGLYLW